MSALLETPNPIRVPDGWPPEVDLILSSLEAGEHRAGGDLHDNRRAVRRQRYRILATLRLFSDQLGTPEWVLYTRDANPRGLGFITPHRLPLGYGGTITLAGPDGRPRSAQCTILRCREAAPGWYEGGACFNREQAVFELVGTA